MDCREQISFTPVKIGKKNCYRETTLKLSDSTKSYLRLLDLFFRPSEVLGEDFPKIFLDRDEADYHDYHKTLLATQGFLPWNGWLFRGQSHADYNLATKFQRLCFDRPLKKDLFDLEQGIIRDFRRTVGAFYPVFRSIDENDLYEYMSQIQHFGGATRFLDVTFSIFVALFFAVQSLEFRSAIDDKKKDESRKCALWCFNRMWIEKQYKKFLPEEIKELYKDIDEFGKHPEIQKAILRYVPNIKKNNGLYENAFLSVINMIPDHMNSRLVRQKGSFLMPTNPYRTFEDNLFNMVLSEKDTWNILKINIEYNNETLLYMQKFLDEMNVNHSVLFENMEGICHNINAKVRIPGDAITVPRNAQ